MPESILSDVRDDAPRPTARPRGEPSPGARRFGYLVSIAVTLALMYLANGVPNWDVPVITNDWPDVLWAVNLSLGASIVASIVFLAFDPDWFRHLAQVALNGLSINSSLALYRVFPFDLAPALAQAARIALIAGMLALGIATIVEIVSFGRAAAARYR